MLSDISGQNTMLFFAWEMMRTERETTRFTIFTLVLREVSYIRPRLPYPVQANEHVSQPPSASTASKLDFTAKEISTAAPPHPPGL